MTGEPAGGWFAGQTAIVTGAARGIGRATAEVLSTLGALVVAVDKDRHALEQNIVADGCVRWVSDFAEGDVEQTADDIWQRHGPVQLLVNNVGIDSPGPFLDLSRTDFDLVFETNLRGPWFFTRQIAQKLVDARMGGAIVFVSSLHESIVCTLPHYSASKAAAAMLVKELAGELAPSGIRVNSVAPGHIRTERIIGSRGESEQRMRRFIPLGRSGEPLEVARMIAVLLSDEWSGYVTGANIRVDGGLALHSWSVEERAVRPASRFGALGRFRRR